MRTALVLVLAGALAASSAALGLAALGGCGGAPAPVTPSVRRADAPAAPAPVEAAVAPARPSRPPPREPRTPARTLLPPVPAPGLPSGSPRLPAPSPGDPFPRRPIDGRGPPIGSAAEWRRGDIDVIVFGSGDEALPDMLPGGSSQLLDRFGRKSDYWPPCIRDFVQTQPEPARAVLGDALSLYSTSCTAVPARRVEFRTPRAGAPAAQSYLGIAGAIEPSTCDASLVAAYHADPARAEPLRAERITLIGDGVRWTSPRLAFARGDGREVATLPLTRSLVRAVQQAIAARDTVLRFEADHDYQDVAVTDEMKHDLRVMLDALDAINRP